MIRFEHISMQLGNLPSHMNTNFSKPFTSTPIRMSRQDRWQLVIKVVESGASFLPQIAKELGMSESHTKVLLKELAHAGAINRHTLRVCGGCIVYKYSPIQQSTKQS